MESKDDLEHVICKIWTKLSLDNCNELVPKLSRKCRINILQKYFLISNPQKLSLLFTPDIINELIFPQTMLETACFHKRLDLVKFLCLHSAFITCESILISSNNPSIMRILLIDGKLDPNRQVNCGSNTSESLLRVMIRLGSFEILSLMINLGLNFADCNQDDLIYALSKDYIRGSPHISLFLLNNGWILSPDYPYKDKFLLETIHHKYRLKEFLDILPQ